MRLTFLGKNTQGGGSPTLFSTDRDSYQSKDGRSRTNRTL